MGTTLTSLEVSLLLANISLPSNTSLPLRQYYKVPRQINYHHSCSCTYSPAHLPPAHLSTCLPATSSPATYHLLTCLPATSSPVHLLT